MKKKNQVSENLRKIIKCYFIAEVYEPYEAHEMLDFFSEETRSEVNRELSSIIEKQLWSVEYYFRLTGFEMQSQKAMYQYLEGIYKFIFERGELPDITQFEE